MKYIFLLLFLIVSVGAYKYSERLENDYQKTNTAEHQVHVSRLNDLFKKSKESVTAYVENEKQLKTLEHQYDLAIGQIHAEANDELEHVVSPWGEKKLPKGTQENTAALVTRYVKDIDSIQKEINKARTHLETKEETTRAKIRNTALEEKQNEELLQKDDQDALIAWINGQSSNARRFNSELMDQLDNDRIIYEKAVVASCKRIAPMERRLTSVYQNEYERVGRQFPVTAGLIEPFVKNFQGKLNKIRGEYLADINKTRSDLMKQERSLRKTVLDADKLSGEYEQEHTQKLQKHERYLLAIKIIACLLCFTLFAATWFSFASSRKVAR